MTSTEQRKYIRKTLLNKKKLLFLILQYILERDSIIIPLLIRDTCDYLCQVISDDTF